MEFLIDNYSTKLNFEDFYPPRENDSSVNSSETTLLYFWDYNPHKKGPKRINIGSDGFQTSMNYIDPIKNKQGSFKGLRIRSGEANNMKPDICRFMNLKKEIKVLQDEFKRSNRKTCATKDKNKIASKICRLKKKAFHDSAKLKYALLGIEYEEISFLLSFLRPMKKGTFLKEDINSWIERVHETKVAGRLDDAINDIIKSEDTGHGHKFQNKLHFNTEALISNYDTNNHCDVSILDPISTLIPNTF